MTRHQPQASRQKEPSRVPAWVWLFTGAVLGAFVMFLLHLSEIQSGDEGKTPDSAKVEVPHQKPRFDFYELLKDTEIPVFDTASEPADQHSSEAEPKYEYLLQVASFKSQGDADRLRAELVLLNLSAYNENAKIRNGETWHRVMVGPFTSRSKLAKARSVLLSNRHEALVLKRPPQS